MKRKKPDNPAPPPGPEPYPGALPPEMPPVPPFPPGKTSTPPRRWGKFRLSEHVAKSGTPTFRATWWEGHKHKCKTFPTAQARYQYILESGRADKSAAAVRSVLARQGDYLAVFAQLPPDVQLALLGAWDKLRAAGGDADDITEAANAHADTLGGGITVAEAVEKHLAAAECRLSPPSVRERRCYLSQLTDAHGSLPLCALTRGKCHDWIEDAKTEAARRHRHSVLSAFLNDCVRREWLRDFPMRGFQKPKAPQAEAVSILTPEQAERLLREAERKAPEMVPYFAVGLFAGLRPERELAGLSNDYIDDEEGIIYVLRNRAKPRVNRDTPVSPNLVAWLRAYPVPEKGIFFSRNVRRRIAKAAGISWTQDLMRHTCASYRLALTRDAVRTSDELGNSVDVLKRHYANRRISPDEVRRFWRIMPSKGPDDDPGHAKKSNSA